MTRIGVGLVLAITASSLAGERLERVGELRDPAIREASGMVASRRHPGIFWVHNDSGNPAELFAVRQNGELVRSYRVAAANVDWEDIATDDEGHLYIGDTGDNKLVLPVHAIYRIDEPDPLTPPTGPADRALKVGKVFFYHCPENRRFDAEGLVIHGNQAWLITKRRDGQPAEVYRLALDQPSTLFRPVVAERVGILSGCTEPVTGATLTADGQRLAVATDGSVRVFGLKQPATWEPLGSVKFAERDVEAITWVGDDLILASENRSIYRVPAWRWKATR